MKVHVLPCLARTLCVTHYMYPIINPFLYVYSKYHCGPSPHSKNPPVLPGCRRNVHTLNNEIGLSAID